MNTRSTNEDRSAAGDDPLEVLPNRATEAQLALYWGVSRRTLQRWRAGGYGPAWMFIGGRVLYRRADVLGFEEATLRQPGHQT